MNQKKLWLKFSHKFGNSLLHPQYIINHINKESLLESSKYIKGRLLDIGCGTMPYRKMLEPLVSEYIGLDHPQVSKLYPSDQKPNIFADAQSLPIEDKTFDTALLLEVLEHLEKPEKALKEIYRILKPKGHLIITVPFMYSIHDSPYDYFRYTEFVLIKMLRSNNFHIVKISSQGNFLQFWLLSLIVFLLKRVQDLIQNTKTVWNLSYLGLLLLILFPTFLLANLLDIITQPLNKLFTHCKNYFPLGYTIVARK